MEIEPPRNLLDRFPVGLSVVDPQGFLRFQVMRGDFGPGDVACHVEVDHLRRINDRFGHGQAPWG